MAQGQKIPKWPSKPRIHWTRHRIGPSGGRASAQCPLRPTPLGRPDAGRISPNSRLLATARAPVLPTQDTLTGFPWESKPGRGAAALRE